MVAAKIWEAIENTWLYKGAAKPEPELKAFSPKSFTKLVFDEMETLSL